MNEAPLKQKTSPAWPGLYCISPFWDSASNREHQRHQEAAWEELWQIENLAEEHYREAIAWLESLERPFTVYRAISTGGKAPNFDELGICWSPEKSQAEAYNGGKVVNVVRGKVELNQVALEETIFLNMVDPREGEFRLTDGAEVLLTGWRHHGESQWRPIEEIYSKAKDPDRYDDEGNGPYGYA